MPENFSLLNLVSLIGKDWKNRNTISCTRDIISTQLSHLIIFILLIRDMIMLADFLVASCIPVALASVDKTFFLEHRHENLKD